MRFDKWWSENLLLIYSHRAIDPLISFHWAKLLYRSCYIPFVISNYQFSFRTYRSSTHELLKVVECTINVLVEEIYRSCLFKVCLKEADGYSWMIGTLSIFKKRTYPTSENVVADSRFGSLVCLDSKMIL